MKRLLSKYKTTIKGAGVQNPVPKSTRLKRALILLFSAAFTTTASAELAGDAERGKVIFEQCASCHMVGDEAENMTGPLLNGLFQRPAASVKDFEYSQDILRVGKKGLVWDYDTLGIYLQNPKNLVSQTNMDFAGLKVEQDRADVMAYLRLFSDDPSNIVEASPTAVGTDHDLDPKILELVGDPEYGEYLSSECTTCHKINGDDQGIPSIINWPAEDFVIALQSYKQNYREHPVMQMMAGRLSDEEIASLAAYFENLGE